VSQPPAEGVVGFQIPDDEPAAVQVQGERPGLEGRPVQAQRDALVGRQVVHHRQLRLARPGSSPGGRGLPHRRRPDFTGGRRGVLAHLAHPVGQALVGEARQPVFDAVVQRHGIH
jgi:hypothetical protein